MWNSLNKIASDSIPHELIKHNYLYILIINCLLLSWNFVILIPRNSFLIAHFKPIMNIPEMQIINLLKHTHYQNEDYSSRTYDFSFYCLHIDSVDPKLFSLKTFGRALL